MECSEVSEYVAIVAGLYLITTLALTTRTLETRATVVHLYFKRLVQKD